MAILRRFQRVSDRGWMMNRPTAASATALLICALLSGSAAAGKSQVVSVPDSQVKAAFLFQFTQFVRWPAAAGLAPRAPLVLGILGTDPFGRFLDDTVRNETVDQHPLVVRRYRRPENIEECHLLFISQSEEERLPETLSALRGRPLLTVSDAESFIEHGGMVQFVTDQNRIRLVINAEAASAAGLVVSSKLLRLATIARPEGNPR